MPEVNLKSIRKMTRLKSLKIDINVYKVLLGVGFSLLWARAMYLLWAHPTFVTFIWFYLIIGSTLLKWIIFYIVDRIHLRLRLRTLQRELRESEMRVHESKESKDGK